ncbi:hypothetical protein CCACVL1_10944, partial [Corchorus capsularis]
GVRKVVTDKFEGLLGLRRRLGRWCAEEILPESGGRRDDVRRRQRMARDTEVNDAT